MQPHNLYFSYTHTYYAAAHVPGQKTHYGLDGSMDVLDVNLCNCSVRHWLSDQSRRKRRCTVSTNRKYEEAGVALVLRNQWTNLTCEGFSEHLFSSVSHHLSLNASLSAVSFPLSVMLPETLVSSIKGLFHQHHKHILIKSNPPPWIVQFAHVDTSATKTLISQHRQVSVVK